MKPTHQIASELALPLTAVEAVAGLLKEGNTVPFIARYRKEATGNLDEVQIRTIQERLLYLHEFGERRATILASIESQGKLTDALKEAILACATKTALEDLYLPYKPKRRTRAAIAREKGLEPLALRLLEQPLQGQPEKEAESFINAEKGVASIEEALAGAQDIAAEIVSERADIRTEMREAFASDGILVSKVLEGKDKVPTKFEQYYDYREKVSQIPSHRYLAIRRGENEGILDFHIEMELESILNRIRSLCKLKQASHFAKYLDAAIQDSCKRLLMPSLETDCRVELKLKSDRAAVDIFAENLRNLLLSSPLGGRSVIGIDPGLRTGCKCAAVDDTGKYLDTVTIFPTQNSSKAERDLLAFIAKHRPYAIGIGNGTGGRETESLVRKLLVEHNLKDIIAVQVSEAGASVYSASDIAREEFPDLDLTIRGAISIARRLQDPLAELVKVDPKAIGVGQYQHDVFQPLLQEKLDEVVESCVNRVGVELNTASAPLLSRVAGIGPSLALKIVKHREQHGAFRSRKALLDVLGLGPRTFQQAAGFLRVRGGEHPLDASAVHPERYELVETIAKEMSVPLQDLIANQTLIQKIDIKRYIDATVGSLTLQDIISELQKPGRDPRAIFERPAFRDDVLEINDLKIGMKLEGIVTNVTAFGAFVDIGVHQDGLIHISELTDRFIRDPSEVVRAGDKIKVEVLTVDCERKRIALSAKQNRTPPKANSGQIKPRDKFGANPFGKL
ncbi:MAG: RNA-binding transcriptional accessory protein [Parachlamydia sp.]|nr:RNA-binding transcriptional accessory protein [Parachlamydia sp.]